MILTWMFSLFLGILAGPCAIDAKNQKEKKDYGVFLSIDSSQIKKLYGYRLVVKVQTTGNDVVQCMNAVTGKVEPIKFDEPGVHEVFVNE